MGKYESGFQDYLAGRRSHAPRYGHSISGAQYLLGRADPVARHLSRLRGHRIARGCRATLASRIGFTLLRPRPLPGWRGGAPPPGRSQQAAVLRPSNGGPWWLGSALSLSAAGAWRRPGSSGRGGMRLHVYALVLVVPLGALARWLRRLRKAKKQ